MPERKEWEVVDFCFPLIICHKYLKKSRPITPGESQVLLLQ